MSATLLSILNFITNALLAEFVVVVAGVLFAQFIQNRWVKWRYGNWQVLVRNGEQELLRREISPAKTKDIFDEPADLSVFLKGVASPYGWIHCDLLTRGKELGLFVEDKPNRRLIVDFAKNPPNETGREGPPKR